MTKYDPQRAGAHYRGLKVTVTQNPGEGASVLSVAVKRPSGAWDDWNLLFPAIRVQVEKVSDYRGVMRVAIRAFEALLEADERNR